MVSGKFGMTHVFANLNCFKILVTFNELLVLSKTANEKVIPDLFIVSCLSVVLLAIGGILKLKNRRNS